MGMDLIEMRKSVWQLSQMDRRRAAIHLAHVVAFECFRPSRSIVDCTQAYGDPVSFSHTSNRSFQNNCILCNYDGHFLR